jgi:hypothetical protein
MRTNIHSEVTSTARHSPRNGFTAYFVLSPAIGCFATVASRIEGFVRPG